MTEVNRDINAVAGDVFAAARTRRSIRAYKSDLVPQEVLREIVALGRHAPSGSNIQPWRVHVLTGAALQRVGTAIQQAFLSDEPGHQRDYEYYTDPVVEPYLARRRACGWGLYGTLGIGRGDHETSRTYRAGNYNFFGAPAGLVFTIDRALEKGSWLDYGMFLQTLMLAARGKGLHTCPEASIASWCGGNWVWVRNGWWSVAWRWVTPMLMLWSTLSSLNASPWRITRYFWSNFQGE